MNPTVAAFSAIYAAWLDVFRSLIPGGTATPSAEATPKAAQAEAVQEWEDEGGSIKPEKKPDADAAPKIPF